MAFEVWHSLTQIPTLWLSGYMTLLQTPPTHTDTFGLKRGVCSGSTHFLTPSLPLTLATVLPVPLASLSSLTSSVYHIYKLLSL